METIIGTTLKALRKNNQLSQQQVADYLCVSRPTYNRYESNIVDITIMQVLRLSELYKVDLITMLKELLVERKNLNRTRILTDFTQTLSA